jgi:uncharacterized FAD-dependent dehydrogenase
VFVLQYIVSIDNPLQPAPLFEPRYRNVQSCSPVVIVGCGPAGMFAALRLIELGLKPIVLERGKDVRRRRIDVAAVSKRGVVDPDSNYCFGEGGAGTFSDGKLYTRATKRGSVEKVLQTFVYHGATPEILIDAHPHIGTNKLPKIVAAMSDTIRAFGGEVHFGQRLVSLERDSAGITSVTTASGERFTSRAVVLATGHSARDVFALLADAGISLEAKPFALGVRVEHPQEAIDSLQYGPSAHHPSLPPASYALRAQVLSRAVFSFCMCPGGVICPAATAEG